MVQDHVHMLIRIPPEYSVAEVVGYIKGKSAISVAGSEILMVRIYGHEVTLFQQLALRSPKFVRISETRNNWSKCYDENGNFFGGKLWQPLGLCSKLYQLVQSGSPRGC